MGSRRGGGQSGEPAVGTRGAATAAPLPVCPVLPRELWAVWSPCRSVLARSLLRHTASAGTRVSHGQPPSRTRLGREAAAVRGSAQEGQWGGASHVPCTATSPSAPGRSPSVPQVFSPSSLELHHAVTLVNALQS